MWKLLTGLTMLLAPLAAQVDLEAGTDEVFAKWNRDTGPGMAVGVIKDGDLVYAKGFGMANLEHGVSNGPKTIFRIASTSKQFTAMCIAILARRGKLGLDDPIEKHVAEWTMRGVTVRDLVHHASGVPDYLVLEYLSGRDWDEAYPPEESLDFLYRWPSPFFEPRTRYSYSNGNYLLLGELVRRLSGKKLAKFAKQEIFDPLGMVRTHFHDRADLLVPGRADGYNGREGSWRKANTLLEHVGDGGVFTCVEDLARWDANFYDNELCDGDDALIPLVLTPGRFKGGKVQEYAFGLDVRTWRGQRRVAHGGAFVGFRAQMMRFPDARLSVICLANQGDVNPTRLCERVAELWLGDKLAKRSRPARRERPSRPKSEDEKPDAAALKAYVGSYRNDVLDATWKIGRKGTALEGRCRSVKRFIAPVGGDVFWSNGETILFERGAGGRVRAMVVQTGRAGAVRFARID